MFSLKMSFSICVFLIVCSIKMASLAPVKPMPQAEIHSSNFGHSKQKNLRISKQLDNDKTWSKAFTDFQSSLDFNSMNNLNANTLLPRCGVQDNVAVDSNVRPKRYVSFDFKKPKTKEFTYSISKYSNQLKRQQIDKEIARAFDFWSAYTDLTFTKKQKSSMHIELSFEKYSHGNCARFDGPGGVLAHAGITRYHTHDFYGYDIHFDDSERWLDGDKFWSGKNLFQIAVHEIGHILGLDHSNQPSSVMFSYYRFNTNFRLNANDIRNIRALYGNKN